MSDFNVAWLTFKRDQSGCFSKEFLRRGEKDEPYLENRLALAFAAGWRAAESQRLEITGKPPDFAGQTELKHE